MNLLEWIEENTTAEKYAPDQPASGITYDKDPKGLHVISTCKSCTSFQGEPNYAERKGGMKLQCKQFVENDGDTDFGCIHWEKKDD